LVDIDVKIAKEEAINRAVSEENRSYFFDNNI